MSNILPPGYVRWDGVKYVFDSDIEIVGPAGPPGEPGAPGPMGPEGPSTGPAGGDLDGDFPNPIVIKIQEQAVSNVIPNDGYYLKWDDTLGQWSGSVISKVQNYSISATTPNDGHYWKWNQSSNQWESGPVTKIQDNEIASGVPADGDYLRWNSSTTKWVGSEAVTIRVQDGSNYGHFLDIIGFSTIQSTNSTIFVNAATFVFDPSTLNTNGSPTVKLIVVAETTGPLMSIQLYNVTEDKVITGSDLSTTSVSPVILSTSDILSGLTSSQAIYMVQIKMASGTFADQINLDYASLKVEWS